MIDIPDAVEAGISTSPPLYTPWLGSIYQQHAEASRTDFAENWTCDRTLVLGESHYHDESPDGYDDDTNLTTSVFNDWHATDDRGGLFFRRIAHMLAASDVAAQDRTALWRRFAFANFVQSSVATPRTPPSQSQYLDARVRFWGLLDIARPTVVLVLGKRNWENLPYREGCRIPKDWFANFNIDVDCWFYPYVCANGQRDACLAVNVCHPSARQFDVNLASAHYRAVVMAHCNVLDDLQHRPAVNWLD
jgi:hypothetical protein